MSRADFTVEIAFGYGFRSDLSSVVWTDVSSYVEATTALSVSRGRGDELSTISPAKCTVTFDNTDGRFTPLLASGAYYPNVLASVPIRVTATYDSVAYPRFTGYVESWPVEWPDGTDARATVTVSATAASPRLSYSMLRALATEEQYALSPRCLFPFSEAAGGSGNDTAVDLMTANGNSSIAAITLAQPSECPTDDLTGAKANAVATPTTAQRNTTAGAGGFYETADVGLTVEFGYFSTGSPAATDAVPIVSLRTSVANVGVPSECFDIGMTTAGYLTLNINAGGTDYYSANPATYRTTATVNDGAFHWVQVTLTKGATSVPRVYVDNVLVFTGAAFTNHSVNLTRLWLSTYTDGFDGTATNDASVSHLALYDRVLTDAERELTYQGGKAGFVSYSSDERFIRIAGYAGVTATAPAAGLAASIPIIKTENRYAGDVLHVIEAAERGLIVDGRDGGIVFQTRAYRPSRGTDVSLSATAQEIESDFAATYDKFGLANEVTATSSYDPLTVTAGRAVDTASDAAHGPYSFPAELYLSDAVELQAYCDLVLLARKDPSFRIPSITVDVANAADTQTPALLALDVGSRVVLTALPAQMPTTAEFYIEGIAESVTFTEHKVTLNLSPTTGSVGWVLDSTVRSVLDSTTLLI